MKTFINLIFLLVYRSMFVCSFVLFIWYVIKLRLMHLIPMVNITYGEYYLKCLLIQALKLYFVLTIKVRIRKDS